MNPRKSIHRIQETVDTIPKCNAKKSLMIAVQQANEAASPREQQGTRALSEDGFEEEK